jgi:hypothetical protein
LDEGGDELYHIVPDRPSGTNSFLKEEVSKTNHIKLLSIYLLYFSPTLNRAEECGDNTAEMADFRHLPQLWGKKICNGYPGRDERDWAA